MKSQGSANPLLPHLAVCVTFFYNPARLEYLATVVSNYVGLASKADLYVITNVEDAESRGRIRSAMPTLPAELVLHFVTPSGIGHPYLLTWTHRDIFQQVVAANEATHFLYSEDDLAVTYENLAYWLRAREVLRPFGLFPSFLRVEKHASKGWCSTDCKAPIPVFRQPKVATSDGTYICVPNPYQGLYFLDRELMAEFAQSPALSPDFGNWGIREKAAQGLTFANLPKGFTSRNLLLINEQEGSVPEEC